MPDVTTLFWDMGGVILTNAWDRAARRRAVEKFHLDWEDFADRHELLLDAFETGQVTLDKYLDRVIFYRERPFSRDDFKAFMYEQSQPRPDGLALLSALARTKKYVIQSLNNESAELNEFRIRQFHLRDYFVAFLSSCYLGIRKPDERIYRLALSVTQRDAGECVFIDDRALNLECAKDLGMRTVHYKDSAQLQADLAKLGVQMK